jgi:hypothetical protein
MLWLECGDETAYGQNPENELVRPDWVLIAVSGQVLLPVQECSWS